MRRPFLLAAALVSACTQPLKLTPSDAPVVLAGHALRAPNPGLAGPLRVRTLYYGSGTDRRRAVFRDSVVVRTKPVDASPFVSMTAAVARSRRKYWGFDAKQFPLNARVWMPEGAGGPFPLVLVVHGNHDPKDFSDPGYDWLGTHLASRGFIVASVDENFLNGSLRQENDARAWMLLEHLKRWRAWNDSAGSPFRGKVDLSRIALVGHSRGGEAVAHAAAFNRLARYPDDAKIAFDYGFAIGAVVAIAPVDAQYKPAGQFEPLENVSYLVIHGSHDGDVSNFHGLRQYQRVRFTDGRPHFKSAFYVYRANHGQWNTVWGNRDNGPRSARRLDLRGLLRDEEQRQFGRVVIGGFLEATLNGRREYLPLFRDHRTAGDWLPKTMYVTRFQESGVHPIATFEEDVDPATGTARGVRIAGDSLASWKEAPLKFRAGDDPMNTNAAWIGWNNRIPSLRSGQATADTFRLGIPAAFSLALPDSIAALFARPGAALVLSLAPTRELPPPRAAPKDTAKKADPASGAKAKPAPRPKKEAPDTTPMDLTVELVDADGRAARVPLSRYGPVRRPLEARILRRADREKAAFPNTFELVLQTYALPVADFPAVDASRLRAVRLVFDRTVRGAIVLDDVGVSVMDPAWWSARVP